MTCTYDFPPSGRGKPGMQRRTVGCAPTISDRPRHHLTLASFSILSRHAWVGRGMLASACLPAGSLVPGGREPACLVLEPAPSPRAQATCYSPHTHQPQDICKLWHLGHVCEQVRHTNDPSFRSFEIRSTFGCYQVQRIGYHPQSTLFLRRAGPSPSIQFGSFFCKKEKYICLPRWPWATPAQARHRPFFPPRGPGVGCGWRATESQGYLQPQWTRLCRSNPRPHSQGLRNSS